MVELVAKRYGTAIYQLAVEKNQIDTVAHELAVIKNVLETEDAFVQILSHPKIVVEEKIALVESIFKSKVSDDVMGLIVLTIVKGRQSQLIDIADYCEQLIDEYNNIVTAYVTTTENLSEPHKVRLKERLEALTKKTVNTNYDTDESLIAGMVIRIGDRILDNSIKGQLASINKTLLEA